MSLCVGTYTVLGTLSTIGVGVATPDDVRTYVTLYGSPIDGDNITLASPSGTFGIDYDLSDNIRVFAEHHSSPMDCGDHPGLNMAGIKLVVPLAQDLEVYSGVAVHNEGFDSNNNLSNPIVVGGIEYGHDVAVFGEYITDYNFNEGTVNAGIKFYFN